MTDELAPWRCAFGFLHAIPSLAAACTGATHGIPSAEES